MTKIALTVAAVAFSGLASGALGMAATAGAAPSGGDSAQDTISRLEGDGYQVIVQNLSSRPLEETSVESVMPADSVTSWVWSPNRDHRYQQTTYTKVFVTVR
jgi:hypothetical protein